MKKTKTIVILIMTFVILIFLNGCAKNNNAEDYNNQISSTVDKSEETETIEEKNAETNGNNNSNQITETSDINVGLLLGVSEPEGLTGYLSKYKTIWITNIDGKLSYSIKEDVILVPHGNDFYKIKNANFNMSKISDEADKSITQHELYDYEYKLTYNTIGAYKINEKETPLYTEEYIEKQHSSMDWPIQEINQKVIYAGNEYITIMGDEFETGGGTYNSGNYYVKTYKISELNSSKNFKKLSELVSSEKAKEIDEYNNKYNKTLQEIKDDNGVIFYLETQRVDWDNIVLGRQEGAWVAQVPVVVESEHYGNGSNFCYPNEFLNIDTELPQSIAIDNTLSIGWDKIKTTIPDATDAVSSKNGELLAVIANNKILIFKDNNEELSNPDLSIDIDSYENIVSNQWAYGKYVSSWNEIIN
jgi:hypothetical protein